MRTTITIDDKLFEKAREYSGIEKPSALVNAALKMLVEWEASQRLAALGGSDPYAWTPERERPAA